MVIEMWGGGEFKKKFCFVFFVFEVRRSRNITRDEGWVALA